MPANSSFLDAFGQAAATPAQIAALQSSTSLANAQAVLGGLYGSGGADAQVSVSTDTHGVVVALTIERANDPSALLSGNWAARQTALANTPNIWGTYGADPTVFSNAVTALADLFGGGGPPDYGPMTTAGSNGYSSTSDNRTIWMQLNATQFSTLFGTQLLDIKQDDQLVTHAWGGNLGLDSLPDAIEETIAGIWVEFGTFPTSPVIFNTTPSNPPMGPLGIGNAAIGQVSATPAAIAANYRFPLPANVPTPAIALVEGGLAGGDVLLTDLNLYRQTIGLPLLTADQFRILSGATLPQGGSTGELTLDISVVSGAAPNSTQLLYSDLNGNAFYAYQQAFFDSTNNPSILSSSYASIYDATENSPFQAAYEQLFIDGLLSNVSVHLAAGDSGSNGYQANGLANAVYAQSPTYALVVGGTSIASLYSAESDSTLNSLLALALQDDPATVFNLVAAGLRTLPSTLRNTFPGDPARTLTALFESAWQSFGFTPYTGGALQAPFGVNEATSGGVETALPVPGYQTDFGLIPTSSSGIGRGLPDVSALSAGDTQYAVLSSDYVGGTSSELIDGSGGTSAASPLWASLTAQFNAVFSDQGLPDLGFYNDLLYTAAAITPAAFNDTRLGSNTTSFYQSDVPTGYYNPISGSYMVPTADGNTAVPGYDLATGLGTPDGLVLARSLSAIGHAQMYSDAPAILSIVDTVKGTSIEAQTLLVQNQFAPGIGFLLEIPGQAEWLMSGNAEFGWTARLAGQAVQGSYFDPGLVLLFDKATKSAPQQISVQSGDVLSATVDGIPLPLYQAALTSDYGFVQYGDAGGTVVLARPVAIAQTAGGADDQNVVVRIRQDGTDTLQLEIYRVDDLNGTIGGIAPGQAGYAAAAAARDYQTTSGTTVINGPGYGNYMQVQIADVDQGDILALKLTDVTTNTVSWALTSANGNGLTSIYNYGFNTFGFEDRRAAGDNDFNDLIVQFDFTSTSGQGWLIG